MQNSKKQHLAGLIMLSLTAVFWGAGFVLNSDLLNAAFRSTPILLNAIRFVVSALVLGIIFARKLKFNRYTLLYAGVGGLLLFGGFTFQLFGLRMSTPSHNGFFTAAYIVFVPFITWILLKHRPQWQTFLGVGIALAGLAILNIDFSSNESAADTLWGDLLTLSGAVLFAIQIAWTDYAYKKDKIDCPNMTFWQVLCAALCFAAYTLIFESKRYSAITFDPAYCVWRLVIVVLCGTAFAYFAQSYAQKRLSPTETSIILACESPIGAVISVACGAETFVWNTAVGGALVIVAVIIIEVLPYLLAKRNAKRDKNENV